MTDDAIDHLLVTVALTLAVIIIMTFWLPTT